MMLRLYAARTAPLLLAAALTACPIAVDRNLPDGSVAPPPLVEAGSGLNPDGADPFNRRDSGVILVDGAVMVGDAWVLPDSGTVTNDNRYGAIRVGEYVAGGSAISFGQAEFRLRDRPENPGCSNQIAGNWGVQDCLESPEPPMDDHPTPFPHAGVITFTGGRQTFTLRPSREGTYPGFYEAAGAFPGGTRVDISARGDTVPAFRATAEIPPDVRLLSPDPRVAGGTLRRNRDFVLRWEPTRAETIWVYLAWSYRNAMGQMRHATIYVDFYGDAGSGSIPAGVLEPALSAAPAGTMVTLTAFTYVTTRLTSGAWPISIAAYGTGPEVRLRLE